MRSSSHLFNIAAAECKRFSKWALFARDYKIGVRHMTTWTKPEFVDLRLGLEVTLYISNR
ncbi:Coenzyme PQQ synthesis protein A (modular protein) [Serratia sp. Tan611]|nr:Coenzyme PQQ synthesis protein A (modular protein) [Serratia sp. Tan611]